MNIIEEITKKYNGNYSEEFTKQTNTISGKYTFQPKRGVIDVDGTKISINLNEVGGASPITEPIRIILHLNKIESSELFIYPIGIWETIINFIKPKSIPTISNEIRKQFKFEGNKKLQSKLLSDYKFISNLLNEKIYLRTNKSMIILTPEHGIDDLEQFEKFLLLLKLIEKKLKT